MAIASWAHGGRAEGTIAKRSDLRLGRPYTRDGIGAANNLRLWNPAGNDHFRRQLRLTLRVRWTAREMVGARNEGSNQPRLTFRRIKRSDRRAIVRFVGKQNAGRRTWGDHRSALHVPPTQLNHRRRKADRCRLQLLGRSPYNSDKSRNPTGPRRGGR